MLALFLLLVLVAMVLGIVGVVVHGLLYLLIIGIVVFLGALTLAPCGCGGGPAGARRGEPQAARVTTGRDSTPDRLAGAVVDRSRCRHGRKCRGSAVRRQGET